MKNKEYYSLKKMVEYIEKIEKYTKKLSFDDFENDEMVIDATIFAISQIGELVKNISIELRNKYALIQWTVIKGMRNKIVHDYEGINLQMIWIVIQRDLPKLKENLVDILKELNS